MCKHHKDIVSYVSQTCKELQEISVTIEKIQDVTTLHLVSRNTRKTMLDNLTMTKDIYDYLKRKTTYC